MTQNASPRVNSKRLKAYMGKAVRLPCKILETYQSYVLVEATDGGQVQVEISGEQAALFSVSSHAEVVGLVQSEKIIKCSEYIPILDQVPINLEIIDNFIETTHKPMNSEVFSTNPTL